MTESAKKVETADDHNSVNAAPLTPAEVDFLRGQIGTWMEVCLSPLNRDDRKEMRERLAQYHALAMRSLATAPDHTELLETKLRAAERRADEMERFKTDAMRWRVLEHGCRWVSFMPTDAAHIPAPSFDPRNLEGPSGLKAMRQKMDEALERHLKILRDGAYTARKADEARKHAQEGSRG